MAPPEDFIDPRDGPLNRARLTALEDLIPDFEEIADVTDLGDVGGVPVTDDQFLAYMNRSQLISDRLIGELKELVSQIDLSDEAAISSRSTRKNFEAMLDASRRVRAILDELLAMTVPEQFARLHQLLVAVYHGVLILYHICATAFVAVTIEYLSNAQRDAQAMLDRLALLAGEMGEEISRADPEQAGTDQVNRRLRAFVGREASYEHDGRPDLAAVLAEALREGEEYSQLGEQATRLFRGLALIDPVSLLGEDGLFLYMLAAELAASNDPVTVRRRTSVLLDVLRQAFYEAPQAMVSVLSVVEAESEQAIVYWLNERDVLHVLPVDRWPPEAVMQKLTQSYHALLEGTYRRLTTPFLEASFILHGASKRHEEVAVADVATRINWLDGLVRTDARRGDPRFQSLLAGVSVVLRHAVAHGDVETADTDAVVTHRSGDSVRTILTREVLSIDDVVDRLLDLSISCHAMRLAYGLFRTEFRDRLPAPSLPTSTRVATELAAILVGLWGLARAEVDRGDHSHVRVRTQVVRGNEIKAAKEYAAGAFTLATIFPQSATLTMEVSAGTEDRRIIIVPTNEVQRYQNSPEEQLDLWFLRLLSLSKFDPPYGSEQERYISDLIRPLAVMVMREFAPLNKQRSELPLSLRSYAITIRSTIRRVSEAIAVVESIETPNGTRPVKSRTLEALRSIRKGLVAHDRNIVAGRWKGLMLANADLERGARLIIHVAAN